MFIYILFYMMLRKRKNTAGMGKIQITKPQSAKKSWEVRWRKDVSESPGDIVHRFFVGFLKFGVLIAFSKAGMYL